MINADDILHEAAKTVAQSKHGDITTSLYHIAIMWNTILRVKLNRDCQIDSHDVANMMEGLKIARRYTGDFDPDDYVDGAGYAACAFETQRQPKDFVEILRSGRPITPGDK